MYYKLTTETNSKGNEIILKQKVTDGYKYEVTDLHGRRFIVSKDWLLNHQKFIVNLSVKSNNSLYLNDGPMVIIWDYWCHFRGEKEQGKMTISKILKEYYWLDEMSFLKARGYDGIVIKNAPVGIKQKRIIRLEIVVFKPSQIKSVYNLKPMKTDSLFDGYKPNEKSSIYLTEEQYKYFRFSKIKANSSNPMVCYHSTNAVFDKFDISRVGEGGGSSYGKGFYFSSEPIEEYGRVMKVYLDVRKPYVIENVNDFSEVLRFLLFCFGK